MTPAARTGLGIAIVVIIFALAMIGQRLAPPIQAGSGSDFRKQQCDVDAPEPLRAAAKVWCANGLFMKATVTAADAKNVVAVMQFTPNGAQSWQLQSGLLSTEFRSLTDRLAAAAPGKDISVALHDAGDRRIGVCARAISDASATCGTK
jgi:hypothetical protein